MSQTNRPTREEMRKMSKKVPKMSACEEVSKLHDNGLCKPYEVMNEVLAEVERSSQKYPPMRSAHEGHSIIREEYLELENEVFIKHGERDAKRMRYEAVQLAAMSIRFIMDICYGKEQL